MNSYKYLKQLGYDEYYNICLVHSYLNNINMTLEARLVEILIRKEIFANTKYHLEEAKKLKKYFDNKLGYNLYEFFPNIIKNI